MVLIQLKFWRIAAIVLTLSTVAFISVVPQVSNDFWLQVKVGEMIANDHAIPKTVLFPFTEVRDAPFNAHEWLPSLFFYWLIKTVGENGLPLTMGLAGIILFFLMAWLAYERSDGNFPVALLLGLVAVGVENQRHYLRPELISLFMMGIYWILLESCRKKSHYQRWVLAWLLVVLWANSHGSFILAPLMSAAYAAGSWIDDRYRGDGERSGAASGWAPYAIFTLTSFPAMLVNPVGIDLLKFVFDFGAANSSKVMVAEWLPTFDSRWFDNRGFWISMICGGFTIATVAAQWKKLRAIDIFLYVLFTALAVHAIRFLVYLGVVASYMIPKFLPDEWKDDRYLVKTYTIVACFSAIMLGLSMKFGNAFGAFPHTAFEAS